MDSKRLQKKHEKLYMNEEEEDYLQVYLEKKEEEERQKLKEERQQQQQDPLPGMFGPSGQSKTPERSPKPIVLTPQNQNEDFSLDLNTPGDPSQTPRPVIMDKDWGTPPTAYKGDRDLDKAILSAKSMVESQQKSDKGCTVMGGICKKKSMKKRKRKSNNRKQSKKRGNKRKPSKKRNYRGKSSKKRSNNRKQSKKRNYRGKFSK